MAGGRLWLPAPCLRRLREHAETAWPREACGLLEAAGGIAGGASLAAVRVRRLVVCRNIHADPERRFEIDPEDFLRAEHAARGRGRAIAGVWHSHPHGDARPSATDRAAAWAGWSYLIAGVTNGRMIDLRCWRVADSALAEQPLAVVPAGWRGA